MPEVMKGDEGRRVSVAGAGHVIVVVVTDSSSTRLSKGVETG